MSRERSTIFLDDNRKQRVIKGYRQINLNRGVSYNMDDSTRDMYKPFQMYLEKYFVNPADEINVTLLRGETFFKLNASHSRFREVSSATYQYIKIVFTSRYNLYTTFEFLSFKLALEQHYGDFNLDENIDCARAETLEWLDGTELHPVANVVLDYIY